MSFLMIPVSTLYDEYIERRKFKEQKKNPVEYIVPPPSRGSEQQDKLTFPEKVLPRNGFEKYNHR